MYYVIQVIEWLLRLLTFAVIARALLSWFSPGTSNPIVRVLYEVTEPVLEPLRRIIPTFGGIDFTPIIAIFLLNLLGGWLAQSAF